MEETLLRSLPKVDVLLAGAALSEACGRYPYARVKACVQAQLAALRKEILSGERTAPPSTADIEQAVFAQLASSGACGLRRVINATGVILHTNLGRAPLGEEIAGHIYDVARGYCDLESDPETGKRGSRCDAVEALLCKLTGAEAAMVVNNNAGAALLMLHTLANGKRVAISRGELVEIGGGFRVPDILEQSGATLVEVGTTNRTRLLDYETAIREKQATVLLKVHTSNFVMEGFTEETPLSDLVRLGHAQGCKVLYDAGAAFLFPPEYIGIHCGVTAGRCVIDGADAICFSADKLLGLTQAGILIGRRDCIDRMRNDPLSRALRIDKLSLAALEAGLRTYQEPANAIEKIPSLAMANRTEENCRMQAERLAALIQAVAPSFSIRAVPFRDEVGGGALPGVTLPGAAVRAECANIAADTMAACLRKQPVPIVSVIRQNGLLLSARALFPADEQAITDAFAALQNEVANR